MLAHQCFIAASLWASTSTQMGFKTSKKMFDMAVQLETPWRSEDTETSEDKTKQLIDLYNKLVGSKKERE